MNRKKIAVLGITGSIGSQAANIIKMDLESYEIQFITANSNEKKLLEYSALLGAKQSILTSRDGVKAVEEAVENFELDLILIGSSGTEVLSVAYKAAQLGIDLAIANKECLVAAGPLIMQQAEKSGSFIIPVDSEHSAVFQCIGVNSKTDIDKIILTASGGSFRDCSPADIENATLEQALKHPNWSMGKKITIDSATMMNKGLELIEAQVLFDVAPEQLSVLIHPQSIVHSMVAYKDGSVMAQMGNPDMHNPIAYALNYPRRLYCGVKPLNFSDLSLTFYPPCMEKYPCLAIALEVLNSGSQAERIVMNAANELAVAGFIDGKISFGEIARIISRTLANSGYAEPANIEEVLYIDNDIRRKLAF